MMGRPEWRRGKRANAVRYRQDYATAGHTQTYIPQGIISEG